MTKSSTKMLKHTTTTNNTTCLDEKERPSHHRFEFGRKIEHDVLKPHKNWAASLRGLMKRCLPPPSNGECQNKNSSTSLLSHTSINPKMKQQTTNNIKEEDYEDPMPMLVEEDYKVSSLTQSKEGFVTPTTAAQELPTVKDVQTKCLLSNDSGPNVPGSMLSQKPPRGNSGLNNISKKSLQDKAIDTSTKPRIARRATTSNSNVSLHRRQQPLNAFEFDTGSLQRISSTALNDSEAEEIVLSLPRTIDVAMRTVSAMTDFSDDGDDISDDIGDLDAISDHHNDFGKVMIEHTTSSPTCIMDLSVMHTETPTPAWMLQWATTPNESNNDALITKKPSTTDCSGSTVTLEYSLSDESSNQVSDLLYLPSNPVPTKASCCSSDGTLVFKGWVALSLDPSWIFNDFATVNEDSLHYIHIVLPPIESNKSDKLLIHMAHNDETKTKAFSTSMSSICIRPVSDRIGNCLVLEDGTSSLYLLPVNISRSVIRRLKKGAIQSSGTICESFFFPFHSSGPPPRQQSCINNSNNDENCSDGERLYAPDEQQDAVLHLRFVMDAALRTAYLR